MKTTLKYQVATSAPYSWDGYDVEQETETVEYEAEYEATDIIKCYGFTKTAGMVEAIHYLLYEDLLKVDEDETFIEYLKDKYEDEFYEWLEDLL